MGMMMTLFFAATPEIDTHVATPEGAGTPASPPTNLELMSNLTPTPELKSNPASALEQMSNPTSAPELMSNPAYAPEQMSNPNSQKADPWNGRSQPNSQKATLPRPCPAKT